MSRVDGKLVGDVAPDVAEVAGFFAPNPGGVGPMTRAMLLTNVVESAAAPPVARDSPVTHAVRGVPGNRAFHAARRDIPFLLFWPGWSAGSYSSDWCPQHWLRGVLIIGADLILAGVLRLTLPARRAGILVVRSRVFDTIAYVGLGVLVITFAVALPQ